MLHAACCMLHVDVDVELETREASTPRETVENFGEDLKLHVT